MNLLLPDGVVAPRVVVRRVLLAGHQLLGVEEGPVDSRPGLVDHGRLEVDEDGSWNVFAIAWAIGIQLYFDATGD